MQMIPNSFLDCSYNICSFFFIRKQKQKLLLHIPTRKSSWIINLRSFTHNLNTYISFFHERQQFAIWHTVVSKLIVGTLPKMIQQKDFLHLLRKFLKFFFPKCCYPMSIRSFFYLGTGIQLIQSTAKWLTYISDSFDS